MPAHVAIIMDGNGRWATARGKDRSYGHRKGAQRVPPLVEHCSTLGVRALTLYSFSTENWSRSDHEIGCLMDLCVEFLRAQRPSLLANRIRFRHLGRRDGLPAEVLDEIDHTTDLTAEHDGMTLALAINYGGRAELTDAVRAIARRVAAGELTPDAIEPETIDASLYTAGLPDVDLLIRTAGELRISNYLLWQISYAELVSVEPCWPDFDEAQLDACFAEYTRRTRKFGRVVQP